MMSERDSGSEASIEAGLCLEIPADILDQMTAHCRRESPLECCGILGGVSPRVLTIHPLRNIADSETRYEGDPRELVEAWRWLRERRLEILAIYHSHPQWRAVPSTTDRERNYWGSMPHIIVSLLSDPPEVRAWRLFESTHQELSWSRVEAAGDTAQTLQLPLGTD
jgi:proteasome lid subunit RPN8/RPN11